jgi:hypothetical protein
MTRTALAIAIALATGCGRSGSETTGNAPAETPAATQASTREPAPDGTQRVVLVGCLQSPAADTRPSQGAAADPGSVGTTPRFTLVNARPAAPGSSGVGSQGAGASGGPLVTAKAAYELDALPPSARTEVNKQVEVSGRLDTASAVAPTPGAAFPVGTSAPPPGSTRTETTAGQGSVASNAPQSDPGGPSTIRHLVVDSLKVIADACEPLN